MKKMCHKVAIIVLQGTYTKYDFSDGGKRPNPEMLAVF
jgi:hypothetical protein